MAKITASSTSFSNSSINVNNSGVSIAMGDTIAVTIGMSNSIFLGAKTSLTAGAQTNITLGPSSSFTYGNVLSATYGNSWSWSATNNTIYDSASRWGVLKNTYNGGISVDSYTKRWAESTQGKKITLGVFASYLAMVGLTIPGIAWAPFSPTSTTDASPSYNGTTNLLLTTLIETFGVIGIVALQYLAVQALWKWRQFNPVTTLGLTSQGLNSFVYASPDSITASPYANFTMLPGAADATGPSFLEGYVNDATPQINLTASLSPAMSTSSTLTINPTGIIIGSKLQAGGPQLSLSSNNSGNVTIVNNINSGQTSTKGSITINSSTTALYRPQGKISLAVGSGSNVSQIGIQNNNIKLSSGGSNGGALLINSSGVTIGTGATAAKFTSSNITVGGSNGVVLTNSSINIGGALVVTGAALNASLGQAINQLQQQTAQDIAGINEALQQRLAQANETIETLRGQIAELQSRTQFNEQDLTALKNWQTSMVGGI